MGAPFQRGAGLLTEPSRWARAERWLKWLSVGLFVLLLVLGGVVASVVATAPGLRTALRLALPQINELIAGEIAVERVEGALTDRLNLYGVTITAPDGTVALRAERITVEVLLSKLLHKRALVRELEIVRPEVTLYDKAGAIAFASAFDTGEPASEDAGPSPWVVRLQDVTLSSGALRLKPDAQPMVDELTLAFGLTVGPALSENLLTLAEDVPAGLDYDGASIAIPATQTGVDNLLEPLIYYKEKGVNAIR